MSAEDEEVDLESEIETLKAIYIKELELERDECGYKSITVHLFPATADIESQKYVRLSLTLTLTGKYPENVPEILLKNTRGLSDEDIERIYRDARNKAEEKKGSAMLFEIIEVVQEHLTKDNTPSCDCAICLCCFAAADVFIKTECYHYFHSHCLATYVQHCKKEDVETNDENHEKKANIFCPICRLDISFDSETPESFPLPQESFHIEEFVLTDEMKESQREMKEILRKQQSQGGIIDVEAEKNKFLLEISIPPPIPSIIVENVNEIQSPDNHSISESDVANNKDSNSASLEGSIVPECISETEANSINKNTETLEEVKDADRNKTNVQKRQKTNPENRFKPPRYPKYERYNYNRYWRKNRESKPQNVDENAVSENNADVVNSSENATEKPKNDESENPLLASDQRPRYKRKYKKKKKPSEGSEAHRDVSENDAEKLKSDKDLDIPIENDGETKNVENTEQVPKDPRRNYGRRNWKDRNPNWKPRVRRDTRENETDLNASESANNNAQDTKREPDRYKERDRRYYPRKKNDREGDETGALTEDQTDENLSENKNQRSDGATNNQPDRYKKKQGRYRENRNSRGDDDEKKNIVDENERANGNTQRYRGNQRNYNRDRKPFKHTELENDGENASHPQENKNQAYRYRDRYGRYQDNRGNYNRDRQQFKSAENQQDVHKNELESENIVNDGENASNTQDKSNQGYQYRDRYHDNRRYYNRDRKPFKPTENQQDGRGNENADHNVPVEDEKRQTDKRRPGNRRNSNRSSELEQAEGPQDTHNVDACESENANSQTQRQTERYGRGRGRYRGNKRNYNMGDREHEQPEDRQDAHENAEGSNHNVQDRNRQTDGYRRNTGYVRKWNRSYQTEQTENVDGSENVNETQNSQTHRQTERYGRGNYHQNYRNYNRGGRQHDESRENDSNVDGSSDKMRTGRYSGNRDGEAAAKSTNESVEPSDPYDMSDERKPTMNQNRYPKDKRPPRYEKWNERNQHHEDTATVVNDREENAGKVTNAEDGFQNRESANGNIPNGKYQQRNKRIDSSRNYPRNQSYRDERYHDQQRNEGHPVESNSNHNVQSEGNDSRSGLQRKPPYYRDSRDIERELFAEVDKPYRYNQRQFRQRRNDTGQENSDSAYTKPTNNDTFHDTPNIPLPPRATSASVKHPTENEAAVTINDCASKDPLPENAAFGPFRSTKCDDETSRRFHPPGFPAKPINVRPPPGFSKM